MLVLSELKRVITLQNHLLVNDFDFDFRGIFWKIIFWHGVNI
jgi:hypothetical protein